MARTPQKVFVHHEWSAEAKQTRGDGGFFRDGEIVVQTVRYTVQQK